MSDLLGAFSLSNQNGETVTNADFLEKKSVLYFYPRDNTAGCSTEAMEFSALKSEFEALGVQIYGVSADSVKKHQNFIAKKELTISLLSDEEHTLLEQMGVWQLKKMAGKEYMGIVRTTLIIDPNGVVTKRWDKVKVKGHVDEVLAYLKNEEQSS